MRHDPAADRELLRRRPPPALATPANECPSAPPDPARRANPPQTSMSSNGSAPEKSIVPWPPICSARGVQRKILHRNLAGRTVQYAARNASDPVSRTCSAPGKPSAANRPRRRARMPQCQCRVRRAIQRIALRFRLQHQIGDACTQLQIEGARRPVSRKRHFRRPLPEPRRPAPAGGQMAQYPCRHPTPRHAHARQRANRRGRPAPTLPA